MVHNVVIFGAPGSGKGTQSAMISEKYGLKHLSTGELLRAEVEKQSSLGKQIESYVSRGNLVPDELIINMLSGVLEQNKHTAGFIFDGFPRTIEQAAALKTMLNEYGTSISVMLYLDVNEDELIKRLLYRGESSGRSDDNYETIRHRIQVYLEKTAPVKSFYEKEGCALNIEGTGSLSDIFKRICTVVDTIIPLK
jgi:adenylate kinase